MFWSGLFIGLFLGALGGIGIAVLIIDGKNRERAYEKIIEKEEDDYGVGV